MKKIIFLIVLLSTMVLISSSFTTGLEERARNLDARDAVLDELYSHLDDLISEIIVLNERIAVLELEQDYLIEEGRLPSVDADGVYICGREFICIDQIHPIRINYEESGDSNAFEVYADERTAIRATNRGHVEGENPTNPVILAQSFKQTGVEMTNPVIKGEYDWSGHEIYGVLAGYKGTEYYGV